MSCPFELVFTLSCTVPVQQERQRLSCHLEKVGPLKEGHSVLQAFSGSGAAASFFIFDVSSLFNSQQECFPASGAGKDLLVEIILAMSLNPYQVNRN